MRNFNFVAFEVTLGDGTFCTTILDGTWAKRGRKGKVIGQDDHRKLCRELTEDLEKKNQVLVYGPTDRNGLAGLVDAPLTKRAYELLKLQSVAPITHRRKFEYQEAKRLYTNTVVVAAESATPAAKRKMGFTF